MVILPWIAWVVFAYFASQLAVSGLWQLLSLPADNTVAIVIAQTLVYVLVLFIGLGIPWLYRRKIKLPKLRETLAINRPVQPRDISNGISSGFVYYAILITVMVPLAMLLPGIINEKQSIGFDLVGSSWWELVLVFLVLVIVVPIAEELLTRGLLFGRIRTKLAFWPTALLVSSIFAIAHWQINVSIDTFILSMVSCYAREKTGALYSSILLHMIKNGLAFALLMLM